jgi:predicted RNase H-like HicB family nuclease
MDDRLEYVPHNDTDGKYVVARVKAMPGIGSHGRTHREAMEELASVLLDMWEIERDENKDGA